MKKIILHILLLLFLISGCEKDDYLINDITGKWELVKGYNLMAGGDYSIEIEDQRIEEYTENKEKIHYDYLGNEISRCTYSMTESVITIFGVETTGREWDLSYEYWFINDTLKIRHDGGFEYYDEFFVRNH